MTGDVVEAQTDRIDIFVNIVQIGGADDLSACRIDGIVVGIRIHAEQGKYVREFVFLRHFRDADRFHADLHDKIPVGTPQRRILHQLCLRDVGCDVLHEF